jgi:hypothetical protein
MGDGGWGKIFERSISSIHGNTLIIRMKIGYESGNSRMKKEFKKNPRHSLYFFISLYTNNSIL